MSNLTPLQKITRARNKLLLNEPFFGVLALKLQIIEDSTCKTAWVDGTRLGYNPEWINTLHNNQVIGLIAHEVMHCVYKHHTRRKNRNPGKWNRAGDHVINLVLLENNFELPPDGLIDDQYKDMSTDHIYTLLEDEDNDSQSTWGEVRDSEAQSKSEKTFEEQQWDIAIRQAADAAKKQGNLKGSLSTLVDEVTTPKIPWREVLRNFISKPSKNDYSMIRPNRRFISMNLYLPSLYSESLGTVVIVIDTSGSVSQKELTDFQSEINCILEDTRPEKVYILYCDTQVAKKVDEYTYEDLPIKLHIQGKGGTNFTAPFTWVSDKQLLPTAFIYFTDLYGTCSAPTPDYPVLWLSTTNKKDVPFGNVIHLS